MENTTSKLNLWDRIMMAATFAEANEADTAKAILNQGKRPELRTRKESARRPELRV